MGYRHTREQILDAATAVAMEGGLAALSFGAVGKRLGVADRTVVYYFSTKAELVVAVVEALGAGLESLLESAFGSERQAPADLARRAWPVLSTEESDAVFSVFFEIVGLAASRQPPYDALASLAIQRWVDWLTPRILADDEETMREGALATVALIDGLLLVRNLLGPAAAEAAAAASGIVDGLPLARH